MDDIASRPAEDSGGNLARTGEVSGGISRTDASKSPRRVLVVDDEPLLRWSVGECLSDVGCDVTQTADAVAALRAVTQAALPFDVVVLDLRLPDMADLSLLSTVRQVLPAARLILMTAFRTPDIVCGAMLLGATVLHKPFELFDLQRLVVSTELGPS